MRDLATLTAEDFAPFVGEEFALAQKDSGPLLLRLARVVRWDDRPGHRTPFALEFLGVGTPVIDHAIHHVSHPQIGELELFLGPVIADRDGTTYEAVFT